VVATIGALRLSLPVHPDAIYLLPTTGFVTLAVVNIVFEYFGFYKGNLWRRLFPRKRD
jgi:hypothetical protein